MPTRNFVAFPALARTLALALVLGLAAAEPTPGQEAKKAPPKSAGGKRPAAYTPTPAPHPNGKRGGTLRAALRENWTSLSPHEAETVSVTWAVAPLYSNLVIYDPFRQAEDTRHLVGELATSWAWSDGGKKLAFKLRRGVKWHDGRPFTARDVKHTIDVAREVSEKRFRLNPRKQWWSNVTDIVVGGDHDVTFLLKRPQQSLLSFLATGYAPIYPAHIDPAEMRSRPVGTGPFRLKEAKPDEQLTLEKNPDYFVKDRPYLDGIVYTVIRSRPSRIAALVAGQVDIGFPSDGTGPFRAQIAASEPAIVLQEAAQSVQDNILLNHARPPFNNVKLRQAVNLALDRDAMIHSIHQGAAVQGGAILPAPYGSWGLPQAELVNLPGYGDPAKNKEQARRLLAAEGHGPANPLKVTVSTRGLDTYLDTAVWAIEQLKQVGIEATLEQFESGIWFPKLARREFEIATNLTGVAPDDPDANLIENYTCGAARNFPNYCNKDVDALIEKVSTETDPVKRLALVRQVDRQLQMEGVRPVLAHRMYYFAHWPRVKNIVPHHALYNWGRMQEVWLDP